MNYDEFTGKIIHRLELPGTGEAVRAIRATLMTLGQRIQAGEAKDLAGSLPMEIGWYLVGPVTEHGERFDWNEFVARVSEIEGIDPPDAAYHAQVIIDLVSSAVPSSTLKQVRSQLPESENTENWGELFSVVDAGGWWGCPRSANWGRPTIKSPQKLVLLTRDPKSVTTVFVCAVN